MALAAAARSRRLSGHLFSRLHQALPHLLSPHCSGDDPSPPLPLPPPPSRMRPLHFALPQSSGTARTLALLPFGIGLPGDGPFRRGFSSLPSYPVPDAGPVLTDAADTAVAAAPASFPSEVAWVAEDSSLSVAAVQHLIDAVHSFTGLNWGLSIAISTVLLRCGLFMLSFFARKQVIGMRKELSEAKKLFESANDQKSQQEALQRGHSLLMRLGLPTSIMILTPYTFFALYYAISNMVEKLPSLKEGGAFWFTDLTTPDALYIFPAMTALFLVLRCELVHASLVMPCDEVALHYSRKPRSNESDCAKAICFLTFPLAACLPQAVCTYFVAWSFASLTHFIVLNQPGVKKLLYGVGTKQACSSSDGPKSPAAEDSPPPVEGQEQPHPREASDSRVDGVTDQSDKKSGKSS